MESKYRYRDGTEPTEIEIPHAWWDKNLSKKARKELLPAKHTVKKIDGEWLVVKSLGKVENHDIADQWNTVLKISKKRAFVDANITACAASDIFTQDMEDFKPETKDEESDPTPPAKPKVDPKLTAVALRRCKLFVDTYKNELSKKQLTSFSNVVKLAHEQQLITDDSFIYMAIGRAMTILIEKIDKKQNPPVTDTPVDPKEIPADEFELPPRQADNNNWIPQTDDSMPEDDHDEFIDDIPF